jgi:general secretion pathway protein G
MAMDNPIPATNPLCGAANRGCSRLSGGFFAARGFGRGRATNRSRDRKGAVSVTARRLGFTFVEMMVVITIIVILISIAIPIYQKSIIRAKESVLHNQLFTLRTVIDNYTYDKEKAPQTLQDLVTDGYLKKMPFDPITNTDQWKIVMEDASQAVNQSEPGIFDIHSNSDKIGLDGTPYSDW